MPWNLPRCLATLDPDTEQPITINSSHFTTSPPFEVKLSLIIFIFFNNMKQNKLRSQPGNGHQYRLQISTDISNNIHCSESLHP